MIARRSSCFIIAVCVSVNCPPAVALSVPKGFESLAQGQLQWVSVSLYGENLGLYKASVSLDNVTFLQPNLLKEDIIKKYGSSTDINSVLSSGLPVPLSRNDHLSCHNNHDAIGCGYLNPSSVAIIYDESNDSVQIFLPERFMLKDKSEDVFFTNAQDSHNGFIHQQNINIVGDKDSQSLSLGGDGTLGLGDSAYINVDWAYTDQRYRTQRNSLLEVNNAYVRQDFWRKLYLQVGEMDSRDVFSSTGGNINLSQLQINKLRGIRIGSTQAWLNRDKVQQGTPLTVFLSNESRIDAYRGNQLLGTFYLGTGIHKIDTRNFPSGSYTVTLRIYENNILVRNQQTPYSSIGFSEQNNFQWFLQAGNLADNRNAVANNQKQVIVAGGRIPLTASISLTAGATLLKGVNYSEGALDWTHGFDNGPLDGVMTARVSYLQGSDGSSGNVQQLSYNDGFSLSYYRTSISSTDCALSGKSYSGNGCYTTSNVLFSVPMFGWNATLGYTDSRSEGRFVNRSQLERTDSRFNQGAPWELLYTTRSRSRVWQAGLNKTFNWSSLNIGTSINAFVRRDNNYRNDDKGGYISMNISRASALSNASVNASWNSSGYGSKEVGYGGSYSHFDANNRDSEIGASFTGINSNRVSAQAYKRAGGKYGRGSLTFSDSYDREGNSHSFSVSGSYNSSLAIDRNGFFWGRWGDGIPASAITFSVDSDDDDKSSLVNVGVDDGGQADIHGNSRALFTVPGYQQTTLRVSESSETDQATISEINKGAGSRRLFMMPGKVLNKRVSVESRYTWLGTMIDAKKRPLDDAIPLNVMSWSPLGKGGFSLETAHPLKSLYLVRGEEYLQCPISIKMTRDVVRWIGTVTCKNITLTSMPAAEKKQAKLLTASLTKSQETASLKENDSLVRD